MKEAQKTRLVDSHNSNRIRMSTASPIQVAVADACSVMRTGLIQTIEAEPQMRVVANAAHRHGLTQALQLIHADVLVIDPVGMGETPVPLLREIMRTFPHTAVVVFSSFVDFVPELLAAGVCGYVAQKETDDQLRLAIRAAKVGQRVLSPLVQEYVDCHALPADRARFEPRELLCLRYMAQGLDNQAICLRMDVGLRTIENYVSRIRAKTGCKSRSQMAAWYHLVYGSGVGFSAEPCLIRQNKTELRSMRGRYPRVPAERAVGDREARN